VVRGHTRNLPIRQADVRILLVRLFYGARLTCPPIRGKMGLTTTTSQED